MLQASLLPSDGGHILGIPWRVDVLVQSPPSFSLCVSVQISLL